MEVSFCIPLKNIVHKKRLEVFLKDAVFVWVFLSQVGLDWDISSILQKWTDHRSTISLFLSDKNPDISNLLLYLSGSSCFFCTYYCSIRCKYKFGNIASAELSDFLQAEHTCMTSIQEPLLTPFLSLLPQAPKITFILLATYLPFA